MDLNKGWIHSRREYHSETIYHTLFQKTTIPEGDYVSLEIMKNTSIW